MLLTAIPSQKNSFHRLGFAAASQYCKYAFKSDKKCIIFVSRWIKIYLAIILLEASGENCRRLKMKTNKQRSEFLFCMRKKSDIIFLSMFKANIQMNFLWLCLPIEWGNILRAGENFQLASVKIYTHTFPFKCCEGVWKHILKRAERLVQIIDFMISFFLFDFKLVYREVEAFNEEEGGVENERKYQLLRW